MVSDKPSNSKDLFLLLWIVFCFLLEAETKTSSNTPTCLLYDFICVFLFIFFKNTFYNLNRALIKKISSRWCK